MNRRTRRRLGVICAAAAVGVASPLWGPRVLRNVPIFGVEEVRVEGARLVPPDDVRALLDLGPAASVWDDPRPLERALAAHPLIIDADVRRAALHRLDVHVREVRPLAFVSTPALVPVDGDGRVVPVDPAGQALDLPILQDASLDDGRVEPEAARRALDAFEQVGTLDGAFARRVSELRPVWGTSVEFVLLPDSPLERVVLPLRDPVEAFRRVGSAVSIAEQQGVVHGADARFENEVVLRMGKTR